MRRKVGRSRIFHTLSTQQGGTIIERTDSVSTMNYSDDTVVGRSIDGPCTSSSGHTTCQQSDFMKPSKLVLLDSIEAGFHHIPSKLDTSFSCGGGGTMTTNWEDSNSDKNNNNKTTDQQQR